VAVTIMRLSKASSSYNFTSTRRISTLEDNAPKDGGAGNDGRIRLAPSALLSTASAITTSRKRRKEILASASDNNTCG
jgi:hypothetical protein